AGNPQLLHRLRLELRVAATIALGFEDEVQRLLATVVDADDEVRDVAARRRAVAVRDLEIEALVLHIGKHMRIALDDARQLALPRALADNRVDLRLARVGHADRLRRREINVARRAARVIGIGDGLDAALAPGDALAGEIDALGGGVGEFEIGDRRDRDPLGDEIALVDPAARYALRVAEQADRQVLPGIAKSRLDEPLGDMEGDRARADVLQHLRRDLDALADDALEQHRARPNIFRRQRQARVVGKVSLKTLIRQFDAV